MVQHPLTTRCRCIESSRNRAGFTLIELVVVIIVVGIVAVVAIPRLNSKTFDTVGFYQEALSSVRYAQKEAVAKRRVVCVSLTGNSITVRFAKAISSFTCDTDLTSPRGVIHLQSQRAQASHSQVPPQLRRCTSIRWGGRSMRLTR